MAAHLSQGLFAHIGCDGRGTTPSGRDLMEFGDRSARAIQHANTETQSMRHEADDGAGVARTTTMKGTFHPCRLGQ